MEQRYKIAIIGAGPGGLSAAARAAELKISHVLLESTPHHANTIQRYQKRKHVMAEPSVLPLRASLDFAAGSREQILEAWEQGLKQQGVHCQYCTEVSSIKGEKGSFSISLKGGQTLQAEYLVLAIGLQGNPRKLGVAGEDLPFVQYTLDDPDAYQNETIIIVGAGDAAIENAVALAKKNKVIIVNRRDEFARAKEANLNLITRYIEQKTIECFYNTAVMRVEANATAESKAPGLITLNTATGEAQIPCHRIIGRLGAIPPRQFVEACGVKFPNEDPMSVPELSNTYESNVSGLYIIGALGGYPLIKQAMNQGYEVVEYILGHAVKPADHELLQKKFAVLTTGKEVDAILSWIQQRIPVLGQINGLMLRELMLDSQVLKFKAGQELFAKNDYTNTFYSILQGQVKVLLDATGKQSVTLQAGEFFGEMSLISGRRRSATVVAATECMLIETPRRTMNKLINSVASVKQLINEVFVLRAIQSCFNVQMASAEMAAIVQKAQLQRYKAGEILFKEGDAADGLHLIRSGSVTVSKEISEKEVVISYVPAGEYVGEIGLLGNNPRMATVKAAVATETIKLNNEEFLALLEKDSVLREQIQQQIQQRHTENIHRHIKPDTGDVISFLMQEGVGEATDVLLIDESLCIRCDNCEVACAETHDGTSRLDREAGPTFASVHVPTSCRHCEHPHCMKDCPPDAIHRAPNGEVYIQDNCIGCGNCESNCPYGVIQMAVKPPEKPGLLSWLFFGAGPGPGEVAYEHTGQDESAKKAVKCDMCKDLSGGPACVRACPTGAAIRIGPEQFVDLIHQVQSD